MQKAVILGERSAGLVDVPTPRAREDWALVKVHVAPMCTEYKMFASGHKADILGHEAAGEVVEIGQPGRVQEGDRVVAMPACGCGACRLCVAGDYIHCQNQPDYAAIHGSMEGTATYAQYLLKQSWLLLPIPDGVSYEQASLACCALGPSFGAFDLMGVDAFDTVLITGAGPVGLGAVVNAVYRGARPIVAESIPYRVQKARELGAAAVVDPTSPDCAAQIRELTGGVGVDKAVDCSGVPAAHRLCIASTRRKGHVAVVGECSAETTFRISQDFIRTGITLHGSWHYNLSAYPLIMKVIQESPLVDRLVSHILPMSQIQQALETSASYQCAKILLKPWE